MSCGVRQDRGGCQTLAVVEQHTRSAQHTSGLVFVHLNFFHHLDNNSSAIKNKKQKKNNLRADREQILSSHHLMNWYSGESLDILKVDLRRVTKCGHNIWRTSSVHWCFQAFPVSNNHATAQCTILSAQDGTNCTLHCDSSTGQTNSRRE